MNKLIAVFIIVLNMSFMHAQTYKELVVKADSYYKAQDYKSSVDFYEKAFKIEQKNAMDLYNAACSASQQNENKKAFNWLNLAIDNGYEGIAHIKIDGDLKMLHDTKEWENLLIKFQKKLDIAEKDYDKALQKEFLDIYADDQEIRSEFMKIYKDPKSDKKKIDSIGKLMIFKDSLNLIRVSKILDEKGWVGKNTVGIEANQTIFLVIQHSPLKTQQKYLQMMRDAVKKGNAKARSLALLEDRIALREGRKQIYGSQIEMNSITKKNHISPLEDPDNVDKRRAEVGLGPIADYVKQWNIVWDIEVYKKELTELELVKRK